MAIGGASMNAAVSGMQANAFRVAVSANNVANVNTKDFKASQATQSDLAYVNNIGQGTQIAATYKDPRPGAPVPYGPPGQAAPGAAQDVAQGVKETSNTELAVEMTGQIAARHAYAANIATVRAVDEMAGTLLDLKR
jgi:flagellar basal-body rod protein FlgC